MRLPVGAHLLTSNGYVLRTTGTERALSPTLVKQKLPCSLTLTEQRSLGLGCLGWGERRGARIKDGGNCTW